MFISGWIYWNHDISPFGLTSDRLDPSSEKIILVIKSFVKPKVPVFGDGGDGEMELGHRALRNLSDAVKTRASTLGVCALKSV